MVEGSIRPSSSFAGLEAQLQPTSNNLLRMLEVNYYYYFEIMANLYHKGGCNMTYIMIGSGEQV